MIAIKTMSNMGGLAVGVSGELARSVIGGWEHATKQRFDGKGFGQIRQRTELRHPARVRSNSRDHNGRNLDLSSAQLAQHVPTCPVWQVDVQQDQVGAILLSDADRGFSAIGFADGQPASSEVAAITRRSVASFSTIKTRRKGATAD
jgi:hypothetical protein